MLGAEDISPGEHCTPGWLQGGGSSDPSCLLRAKEGEVLGSKILTFSDFSNRGHVWAEGHGGPPRTSQHLP